jgi:oxygen-independent coproporphyrinogen-3 oxidase
MYALPQQTLAMAEHDIERAFALQPAHISHYQLTLEPNTMFAARPPQGLPDDDGAWDMQEHCQALLASAGYAQYEVSAYAQPGRQCAHNLNYWRYGDYLGIGAGAHGKLTLGAEQAILRRWKVKHPAAYLAAAAGNVVQVIGGDERIAPARRPFEFMLNALRLVDGFALEQFEARCGLPRAAIAAPLEEARQHGWLQVEDGWVRPTDTGRRFGNDVMALFLEA